MRLKRKIFAGPGRWLCVAVFVVAVAACSRGKPVEYISIDEIPPGPGLLSGEDGEFTLYRR